MQQADLLKRLKIITTVATLAFVVLIVALLVQFGLMAYYHSTLTDLQKNNAAKEAELQQLKDNLAYYQTDEYIEDWLQQHGK